MRGYILIIVLLAVAGCHDEAVTTQRNGRSAMTLELSSGKRIPTPSPEDIRDALMSLDVQRDGEGFVILGPTEMTYVQASGDRKIGFDLEYQEGTRGHHFRAERADYSAEEVEEVLRAYRDGTIRWSEYGDWKRIDW